MHGHNYVALFTVTIPANLLRPDVDELGRVIDFSVIKDLIGGWIEQNWDHGFIYWQYDHEMARLFSATLGKSYSGGPNDPAPTPEPPLLKGHKSYALPYNPTAENMARYLLNDICPILFRNHPTAVVSVELNETENCFATAKL